MGVVFLKLLLSIVLMITLALADIHLKDIMNCSLTTGPSSITKVKPRKYNIQLTIKPEEGIILTMVEIMIHIKELTTNINLHVRGMETISHNAEIIPVQSTLSHHYRDRRYKPNKLLDFKHCKENDILIIIFERNIDIGQYYLYLELISILSKNENNIYFPYSSEYNYRPFITNLYTRNAIRSFFPCWDNPTITAIFNISINHPIYYTVFSNMPILRTTEELQGVRWTYFRETPSMSIYLLAIVIISNITTYTSYQGINSMWFQTDIWKTFKYAHNIAYSATVYLSAYTNIRTLSVFEKLNYIIVPNGLNGMISAGGRQLVLYREEDIKYDEASNYFGRNISVTTLVAYEVARQWFVGFVSLKLENDIWINEILASFYSYYITAQIQDIERLTELFLVQNLQTVLNIDVSLEPKPIMHKAKMDNGIDGLLYSLLYHKKAFVLIHMLHHLLTPEIFQQAIEEYVKVSRTYNLWTIMQKYYNHENKSRYTIKEIIDSWLTTKYYPVLSIQSNNRRRIICYTFDNSDDLAKWKIPINYITKSNLTSYNITNIIWFGQKQMDIINDIDRDDFYILNVGQIGMCNLINLSHFV
ncbi:aminopeptidase M1-A [Harpegnathos saltator]|uniref:aminopeptidase M1-A n=1 Tax=Harpegnathos saltator TaxID=610380 RepID=UPI000DBED417|nr:aminopeptidase M1-A [Harpegnathos saltator]